MPFGLELDVKDTDLLERLQNIIRQEMSISLAIMALLALSQRKYKENFSCRKGNLSNFCRDV